MATRNVYTGAGRVLRPSDIDDMYPQLNLGSPCTLPRDRRPAVPLRILHRVARLSLGVRQIDPGYAFIWADRTVVSRYIEPLCIIACGL